MADYDVMLFVVIPGEVKLRPGIQGNCFNSCFNHFGELDPGSSQEWQETNFIGKSEVVFQDV